MKRAVLLAFLLLFVIFGGGYWLISGLTTGDEVASLPEAEEAAPGGHPSSASEGEGASEVEPETAPVEAMLLSAQGNVVLNDGDGNAVVVPVGSAFPFGLTLKTEEGTARVGLAESVVELYERSAVTIPALDEIRLEEGRVRADAAGSSAPIRVAFAESDAVATTDAGALFALTDGEGSVTVAAEEGSVRFDAGGKSVEIPEGQESSVTLTGTPSAPRVPTSLFLRVRRPPRETRQRVARIAGQSLPGSVVRVSGQRARVQDDGRFGVEVPLREGPNDVVVETQSVRGEYEQERHRIVVDSTANRIESRVAW